MGATGATGGRRDVEDEDAEVELGEAEEEEVHIDENEVRSAAMDSGGCAVMCLAMLWGEVRGPGFTLPDFSHLPLLMPPELCLIVDGPHNTCS